MGRAGSFQRVPLRSSPVQSCFAHHDTPEMLLAGSQSHYGHTPEAMPSTIPEKFFELGQELTPFVRRDVEAMIAELAQALPRVRLSGAAPHQ